MRSFNDLLPELAEEILLRLPVQFLLRFKGVSKHWKSVISDPSFIATHFNRTAMNPNSQSFIVHSFLSPNHKTSLLRLNSLENPINLEHPFSNSMDPLELKIVGSCNGLLCLTNQSGRICLWNPATKRVKDISNFNIQVNAAGGEVSFGFGFDHIINDYKVVRIVWPNRFRNSPRQVEMYSVNEGIWREIDVELDFELMQGSCPWIVKGTPYWLALKDRWDWDEGTFFVSFDVHKDVFQTIPWPDVDILHKEIVLHSMVEFKESLAIIVCNRDEDRNLKASLWAMEVDRGGKGSWTKKFTVGPVSGMDRLVGCLRNGEIVAEKRNGRGRELFLYDPVSKETKRTQVQMPTSGVYSYMESLADP